ncbi:MAG: methyl-accepting chemotaxis protein [Lachnospiraceae bacterium]|nr:methyl-accepting chemotaxis protein [Lachnospiraceae bacterium]
MRKSVKTRLIVIIVAIMAIPLIATTLISYFTSMNEAVNNMDRFNTSAVSIVEHDFKSVVEQNLQILQTVANSVSARKVLKGELDVESVKDWLMKVDAEVGDGNALAITGADGMQVVKSAGDLVDVSEREYFQKVAGGELFFVSDQNISKSSGARICTFIHAVYDLDGTFIGAVQRNYNLDVFNELVKNEVTEKNEDIFIGDNNGDLIAHTSMDLSGPEPVNFSSQQWYTASRSDREAAGGYDSNFQGNKWRMSYQREPITGWVTVVARDRGVAMESANRTMLIIIAVSVVMLIIAVILAFVLAASFTKPIAAIDKAVSSLAEGEFEELTEYTDRQDEFGQIVTNTNRLIDKLREVINKVKNSSNIVLDQSNSLFRTSEKINDTSSSVTTAVDEMARGATEQAETIQRASENIGILSDAIQSVAENAEQLAEKAASMNDASQSSADALRELSSNIQEMAGAMTEISDTMNETNNAVNKVNEKVDGITNIASQTNLLALNASIEAARAGEAGRGFAVVAEEIGKLASDSATTAEEIRSEMSRLLVQSQRAIDKTSAVYSLSSEVNKVLDETVNQINGLIVEVQSTVDGVNNISGLTEECAASKNIIVDAMSSLSAISEENAASTQETAASMQELGDTVSGLAESAENSDTIAKDLSSELEFFKL